MAAPEFDAALGGTEELPFAANSLKFATSRSIEIAAMTESILRPSKTKLIFQTLPVHMRRRVMSHNSKRLPRKLREGHLEQLKKSGLPPKQKRPSRKYRRRPGNLLEEYNRRQKRNVWLETHIWHAKRFHMIERWGYRLAHAPCDKAFRMCYRATSAHCLLQDISYLTPIQVVGPTPLIKEMFSSMTNPTCGLNICAQAYIAGKREGSICLYEVNSFPYGFIGKINFIWVPSNSENQVLWLFVHPSQTKQIESALADLCCAPNTDGHDIAVKKRKMTNKYSENIQFKVLPGIFNRFQLTGPNSHAILTHSLKCLNECDAAEWLTMLKSKENLFLKEKQEYWLDISNASSPSQLPPRIILGLVVKDPRLSRPPHRTKAKYDNVELISSQFLLNIPSEAAISPLWDTSIHDTIKRNRLTNGQYIAHATKTQLVPGEVNQNDPALQSIPVVLVQRSGSQDPNIKKLALSKREIPERRKRVALLQSKRKNAKRKKKQPRIRAIEDDSRPRLHKNTRYGCGWDIIIPSGYGIQFWQTFIMFGARSGGLRETESLAFEMGQCHMPPDSQAGKTEEKRIEIELKEKYFRLPPSKRVNYTKLGISSPFICPWQILLNDWTSHSVNDFFILRNKKLLDQIQNCLMNKNELPQMEESESCLVGVYIKILGKGTLKRHAQLCLPQPGDDKRIKTLFEPQHDDPNEKVRKLKRSAHIADLKRLRRRKIKLKKHKTITNGIEARKTINQKKEPSEYVKAMRDLWIPSSISSIRHSAAREILGFISQGGFSFSEAQSCGVGIVAYNALSALLKTGQNHVLVRNISSRKYRLCSLQVTVP